MFTLFCSHNLHLTVLQDLPSLQVFQILQALEVLQYSSWSCTFWSTLKYFEVFFLVCLIVLEVDFVLQSCVHLTVIQAILVHCSISYLSSPFSTAVLKYFAVFEVLQAFTSHFNRISNAYFLMWSNLSVVFNTYISSAYSTPNYCSNSIVVVLQYLEVLHSNQVVMLFLNG